MSEVMSHVRRLANNLPDPIRRQLGKGSNYLGRLNRWHAILSSMRGVRFRDQLVLLASALLSPATSLKGLESWQDPQLLWNAVVRVGGIGEFSLRARSDDLWHVLPSREPTVLDTVYDRLQAGDVFVDAGANIGVYTALAARLVGPSGRVIAIEMMPETARILREHISLNRLGNVEVIERALADAGGKEVIARVPAGQHGQASIAIGTARGEREARVTTVTLAEILAGVGHVALMKMDLEGAEELALMGAGDALNRVGAVIFEDWGETHLSEVFGARGFVVERLDGNNCIGVNVVHA